MADYARPIEVKVGKGGEEELRPPAIRPLSSPIAGPDDTGQSLGVALGQARAALQEPGEAMRKLDPIGQLRRTGETVITKATKRLRSVRAAAESMEGDLQRAAGHGLSELKQRALEIFSSRYRPGGIEAEAQQKAFAKSKEGFDPRIQSERPPRSNAENAPPPLETGGLTLQPRRAGGLDPQEEQKRQIWREGRALGD